jgi:hypothetical protein
MQDVLKKVLSEVLDFSHFNARTKLHFETSHVWRNQSDVIPRPTNLAHDSQVNRDAKR